MPFEMPGSSRARNQERQESVGSPISVNSKTPLEDFKEFGLFQKDKDQQKLTADGNPQKRRGPKPDAKPAINRRQELNRQAQRTHRERKEMYMKALETEVLRLKDVYGGAVRDRNLYKEAFSRVRDILSANGIDCPPELAGLEGSPAASSGTFSGSYGPPSNTSEHSPARANGIDGDLEGGSPPAGSPNDSQGALVPNGHFDIDQVGINFVLALERPCMDHMQMLCVKSHHGSEEDISGHAMMATCPTASHLNKSPHEPYPHQLPPHIEPGSLLKLLDLSARLPLTGEITPVMAWAHIMRDYRFGDLDVDDILVIMQELGPKVRCYGFGAVLEQFEVQDAFEGLIASKSDSQPMEERDTHDHFGILNSGLAKDTKRWSP